MDRAIVSVIIPAFNAETYIYQALDSVLNQTFDSIEIIVINDGSGDSTKNLVSTFMLNYGAKIRLINIKNSGACFARNLGISLAQGRYVAFLDSDDIWLPEKIEKQVYSLQNNPHAVGSVCFYRKFLDNSKKTSNVIRFIWSQKRLFKWMVLEDEGPGLNSTLLVKTEFIKQIGGYDENLGSMADDLDLSWRINLFGQITMTTDCLTEIRIWPGQIHSNILNMFEALNMVFTKHFGKGSHEFRVAQGNLNVWFGLKHVSKGKIVIGIYHLAKGILCSPIRAGMLPIRLIFKSTKIR
jgi:glycosyltransferase involved in cell wall biosynthesis